MKQTITSTIGALMVLAMAAAPGFAHEAGIGPNGGPTADAGKYHAELVVNGSTTVTVYLTDEAGKPVAVTGFKANAIFIAGSQPVRFPLMPGDATKLVGTAPVALPLGVKGAIQITAPDGSTAQAKY